MRDHICPVCGCVVVCNNPRHARRGKGYYASEDLELSPLHEDIMDVLKSKSAYAHTSGLTLTQVHKGVEILRNIKIAEAANRFEKLDIKIPKLQTVSGRLSELQGKEMVSCVPTAVHLTDSPLHIFQYDQKPRWYIVDGLAAGRWALNPRIEAFT